MKKLQLLLATAFVGVLVALTYYVFEYAVHHSINYIWYDLFNTDQNRLLIIPIGLVLTLIFFGLQHLLDPKSDNHEAHGLGGGKIDARLINLAKILFIGYVSLVAGASLGPEAVLVPACMVVGAFVATKFMKNQEQAVKALAAAGIIALFAAFFHSFIVGFLAIFLVTKQAKVKLSPPLVVLAIIASGASTLTLNIIDPETTYFVWPNYSLKVVLIDIFIAAILAFAGYLTTWGLKHSHDIAEQMRATIGNAAWWLKALVASSGLSFLYLIGGDLVEFTGNQSIQPMFEQAANIGVVGLLWIFIIKLFAIGWSKALGYRGGMVFPIIFAVSVLIAIATQFYAETNFMLGLIGAMVGVLAAERKAKILF